MGRRARADRRAAAAHRRRARQGRRCALQRQSLVAQLRDDHLHRAAVRSGRHQPLRRRQRRPAAPRDRVERALRHAYRVPRARSRPHASAGAPRLRSARVERQPRHGARLAGPPRRDPRPRRHRDRRRPAAVEDRGGRRRAPADRAGHRRRAARGHRQRPVRRRPRRSRPGGRPRRRPRHGRSGTRTVHARGRRPLVRHRAGADPPPRPPARRGAERRRARTARYVPGRPRHAQLVAARCRQPRDRQPRSAGRGDVLAPRRLRTEHRRPTRQRSRDRLRHVPQPGAWVARRVRAAARRLPRRGDRDAG